MNVRKAPPVTLPPVVAPATAAPAHHPAGAVFALDPIALPPVMYDSFVAKGIDMRRYVRQEPIPIPLQPTRRGPKRDRAEYMRNYMRQKRSRAMEKSE